MIIRLKNGKKLIGPDQLADWRASFKTEPDTIGTVDPGWVMLSEAVVSAIADLNASISDETKAKVDLDILHAVSKVKMNAADAGDPKVWHYATALRYREFSQIRWFNNEKQETTEERLLGTVRRNALAHLWWIAETLGERSSSSKPLCEQLFKQRGARLRLWVVDFEPFYGRPKLAAAVVHHLLTEDRRTDNSIDKFFKALGMIAAVSELDPYVAIPKTLIDDVVNLEVSLSEASLEVVASGGEDQ